MGTVPVGQGDFKRHGVAAGRGIAVRRIVVIVVIYVMIVIDRPAVERYRELEPDVRDALAARPGFGQYFYPVEEQVHEIALPFFGLFVETVRDIFEYAQHLFSRYGAVPGGLDALFDAGYLSRACSHKAKRTTLRQIRTFVLCEQTLGSRIPLFLDKKYVLETAHDPASGGGLDQTVEGSIRIYTDRYWALVRRISKW